MPFTEQKKICRRTLEKSLREYTRMAEECYLDREFCFETSCIMKKLAKLVHYAHETYDIAMELDAGTERDGEDDHTQRASHDHELPHVKPQVGARPAAPA